MAERRGAPARGVARCVIWAPVGASGAKAIVLDYRTPQMGCLWLIRELWARLDGIGAPYDVRTYTTQTSLSRQTNRKPMAWLPPSRMRLSLFQPLMGPALDSRTPLRHLCRTYRFDRRPLRYLCVKWAAHHEPQDHRSVPPARPTNAGAPRALSARVTSEFSPATPSAPTCCDWRPPARSARPILPDALGQAAQTSSLRWAGRPC